MKIREDLQHIQMCRPSANYRPMLYPWAEQATILQQRIQWLPEEITNFGLDKVDYARLQPGARYLLDGALKTFTQNDIDVLNNYMMLYKGVFLNGEISRMLTTFEAMEVLHIRAYAFVNDTLGLPDSVYGEFSSIPELRAKHELLTGYTMKDPEDIAATLALVSGFGEGLQLYSQFALMLNFSRTGLMKGLGQILAWSQRDENLHVQGIGYMHNQFCVEAGVEKRRIKDRVIHGLETTVMLEDNFIDLVFSEGGAPGLTAKGMKDYIRDVGNERLEMLGFDPIYEVTDHAVKDWIVPLLGVEHANFFETKGTEYSKGSTRGEWDEVWAQFNVRRDRLQTAVPAE